MDFYLKNFQIIQKRYPKLAEKLSKVKDNDSIQIVKSKKEIPIAKVDGKLIHSLYDPLKEAQDFITSKNIPEGNILVFFGFGLGYQVEEVFNRKLKFNFIIVIESDLELFKKVLSAKDFTKLLACERVIFMVGMDHLEVYAMLTQSVIAICSSPITVIELASALLRNRDYFDKIHKVLLDAARNAAANITTVKHFGRVSLLNAIKNFSESILSPGVNVLYDKFKNIPAIIVSAGPSLDKNIHLLKKVKDKALILSTDTALKILEKHGIEADFVFTIDFKEKSRLHFQDIKNYDPAIIFAAEASNASLEVYKGRRFVAGSNKPFPRWLNKISKDKGIVATGMSVAHFIFNLAVKFGCEPLIFVGQDLSFTDGVTHAQGTTSREELKDLYRSNEEKFLGLTSSISGQEVETNFPMYVYLRHFERLVHDTDRICINATEGGVGIEGTEVLTLKETLDKYCTETFSVKDIVKESLSEYSPPDKKKVILETEKMIKNLLEVETAAGKIVSILENIFSLAKEDEPDKEKIARYLKEIKDPAKTVKKANDILDIIHADLIKEMRQMVREKKIDTSHIKNQDVTNIIDDFSDDYNFQKTVTSQVNLVRTSLEEALKEFKYIN